MGVRRRIIFPAATGALSSKPKALLRRLASFLVIISLPAFAGGYFSGNETIVLRTPKGTSVEAKPRSLVTYPYMVENRSETEREFLTSIELPPEWILNSPPEEFKLGPGESSLQFLYVMVPRDAQGGRYTLRYRVALRNDSAVYREHVFYVEVERILNLTIELGDYQETVRAGEKYKTVFLVANESNEPNEISFEVSSSSGFEHILDTHTVFLDPWKSAKVAAIVTTKSNIKRDVSDVLRFTARIRGIEQDIHASATSSTIVISKNKTPKKTYETIDTTLSVIGIHGGERGQVMQVGFAGSGFIDGMKQKGLSFHLRGPDDRGLNPFGTRDDEYWIKYDSTGTNIALGDNIFSLSQLLEQGHYGRGIEADIHKNKFNLKAFYHENRILTPYRTQMALRLGYEIKEKSSIHFNYLRNRFSEGDTSYYYFPTENSHLLSLDSFYSFGDPLNVNIEFALGKEDGGDKLGNAYKLNSYGTYSVFSYTYNFLKANTLFPGNYKGLDFMTGTLSLVPRSNFRIFTTLTNMSRDSLPQMPESSLTEKYLRSGLNFSPFSSLFLSLEYNYLQREDTNIQQGYKYDEKSWGAGLYQDLRFLTYNFTFRKGKTVNILLDEAEEVSEYIGNLYLIPFRGFTLGGYVYYRDQNELFTSDRIQRLTMNFNLLINLNKFSFNANYRTGVQRRYFDSIIDDIPQGSEYFLLHDKDMAEVRLSYRFFRRHVLSFHIRSFGMEDFNSCQALISYSLDLGIPVRRKKGTVVIRGKVFDEKSKAGIPNLIVRANESSSETNIKGEYELENLDEGDIFVIVDKNSLGPKRTTAMTMPLKVEMEKGGSRTVDIGVVLKCRVRGRVVQQGYDDGKFQANIVTSDRERKLVEKGTLENILLELQDSAGIQRRISNHLGEFVFNEVRPGRCRIKMNGDLIPKYYVVQKDLIEFDIEAGAEKEINFMVVPEKRKVVFLGDSGSKEVPIVPKKKSAKTVKKIIQTKKAIPKTKAERKSIARNKEEINLLGLTKIDFVRNKDFLSVDLSCGSSKKYRSFILRNHNRIVLDIIGVDEISVSNEYKPEHSSIEKIRIAQYKKDIVRIVFDLFDSFPKYHIEETAEGLKVIFSEKYNKFLKKIFFETRNECLSVTIETDDYTAFKKFTMEKPNRLVVDLIGINSILTGDHFNVGTFGVDRIRTGMYKDNVARIVFDFTRSLPKFKIEEMTGKVVIKIYK